MRRLTKWLNKLLHQSCTPNTCEALRSEKQRLLAYTEEIWLRDRALDKMAHHFLLLAPQMREVAISSDALVRRYKSSKDYPALPPPRQQ